VIYAEAITGKIKISATTAKSFLIVATKTERTSE
jgi:hypothetical protein